ncbi:GGDEF domain-containing protein [Solimonas sp. K1W22B-7]|uniref:GGDEF domain-containing protein n=1 Tax=Solimonas sp. K1W22B-7 TaxID=2303331 RepID=UPI0013C52EC8|nr:sensor domain-containing diguanylate cyclase [Solimonas sp. K1W22B-7]
MEQVDEIHQARQHRRFWQRLPAALEGQFRESQRARYRYPRAIFFLVAALAFGLAPVYEADLLSPSAGFRPLFHLIQFGFMVPLTLAASILTLAPVPLALRRWAQVLGVLAFVGGVLLLRYHALRGELTYPSEMLGIVVIAVSLFGGFSSRRVVLLGGGLMVAGIWVELNAPNGYTPELDALSLFYMALIAVLGSLTQEWQARSAWINHRYVTALVRTDLLTGLSSRSEFNHLFPRLLAMGRRELKPLAVVFLDIDHFKLINDRYGHLYGDEVIRRVGRSLALHYARRPWDLCARFGGEEFVLACYDADLRSLQSQVAELLQAVRGLQLQAPEGGGPVSISASAGAIWILPIEESVEQVLGQADALLYRAKETGRNRGCIARAGALADVIEIA